MLRAMAINLGIEIDDTYRNVNGISFQMSSMESAYQGCTGLKPASRLFTETVLLFQSDNSAYQELLKEAIGMTDTKAVHNVQQKVAGGKLLRFHFGKDTRVIRNVTQLYYAFIKSYRDSKENIITQSTYTTKDAVVEQATSDAVEQTTEKNVPTIPVEEISTLDENVEMAENVSLQEETIGVPAKDQLLVDFSQDKGGEISEKVPNKEWIIVQLKARSLTYQDKRSWGGCLWIAGNHALDAFVQECRVKGYKLSYKADGCKTYPNRPVWWTKDHVKERVDTSDFRRRLNESFKLFLISTQKLAASTATQYSQSIEAVERFILERELGCTLDTDDPDEVQRIYDVLMGQKGFVDWDNQHHLVPNKIQTLLSSVLQFHLS